MKWEKFSHGDTGVCRKTLFWQFLEFVIPYVARNYKMPNSEKEAFSTVSGVNGGHGVVV